MQEYNAFVYFRLHNPDFTEKKFWEFFEQYKKSRSFLREKEIGMSPYSNLLIVWQRNPIQVVEIFQIPRLDMMLLNNAVQNYLEDKILKRKYPSENFDIRWQLTPNMGDIQGIREDCLVVLHIANIKKEE